MKLSVLFGVIQMIFGVCIKFSNDTYYRDVLDWITVCIPQMVFMICFFGYMDWMIMYKWVTPVAQDPALNGAPSLINTLISFGLGQTDKQPLYQGQFTIQKWFMIAILLSLPLMLLPKPIIIGIARSYKAKKAARRAAAAHQDVEAQSLLPKDDKATEEPAEPGMDEMIMQGSLESTGVMSPIWIYCAWAVLFAITLGVLMFMDVLECTLHTLRLHWVEFMSKFYMGDGYPFVPYRHFDIIKNELEG
ncbi:H(+)-transporting V0 sector ATPase subunit a [Perkinsus olseni]|nr:H(+)-transporting V0 sector ATPase subunit a [Perkinsus olseni]